MREKSEHENTHLLPVPHRGSSTGVLEHLTFVRYLGAKAYLEHMLADVLDYDLTVSMAYLKQSIDLEGMFREQELGRQISRIRI